MIGAALAATSIGAAFAAAEPSDPAALLAELRGATLDVAASRQVSRMKLDVGMGALILEQGVVVPTTPVAGRPRAFVFLGAGRFQFKAPNDIERRQLELFTGAARLDETVKSAVIEVAGPEIPAALLALPAAAPLDEARSKEAQALRARWLASAERRRLDLESTTLASLVDTDAYAALTTLFMQGETLGDFFMVVDPGDEEQVTLGQRVVLELTPEERKDLERGYRKLRKKGRLADVDLEDVAGRMDTWVASPARGADGKETPGSRGFGIPHYDIDVSLAPAEGTLEGKARFALKASDGGRRAARLQLNGDLRVKGVRADGRDLFFRQNGGALLVVLATAPAAGVSTEVEVAYGGNVFEKVEAASYSMRGTTAWYPQFENELSTFDVTFRHPKSLAVVSGAPRADEGVAGRGVAWERRSMPIPVSALTFEIGDFRIFTAQVGHVAVTLALDPFTELQSEIRPKELLELVGSAVGFYEKWLGRYPLDEMTVVTVPRLFSQGAMGMVSLSGYVLATRKEFLDYIGEADGRELMAHEIAHQWWGGLVGWKSYRDQWISEALASYSAMRFAQENLKRRPGVPLGLVANWRAEVGRVTRSGRTVDELGPLVLGRRLNSSLDDAGAYDFIVYKKGPVVVNTLAATYPYAWRFDIGLQAIIVASRNRQLTSEEFVELCNGAGGADFTPLARQFIYATGLPDVYYDYDVVQASPGKWTVKGKAEIVNGANYRFSLQRATNGAIDVRRTPVERPVPDDYVLPAPLTIEVETGKGGKERGEVSGRLLLRGAETRFEFPLDRRPSRLWLDRGSEVYGLFHSEKDDPKRALFRRAGVAADRGDVEEAEKLFRETVRAKISTEPAMNEAEASARRIQSDLVTDLAWQELARLYMDTDRLPQAEAALASADNSDQEFYGRLRVRQQLLRARLFLLQGRADKAFDLLAENFDGAGKPKDVEAQALLAIAAKQTNHLEQYERARRIAVRGGADLSLLQ